MQHHLEIVLYWCHDSPLDLAALTAFLKRHQITSVARLCEIDLPDCNADTLRSALSANHVTFQDMAGLDLCPSHGGVSEREQARRHIMLLSTAAHILRAASAGRTAVLLQGEQPVCTRHQEELIALLRSQGAQVLHELDDGSLNPLSPPHQSFLSDLIRS